MDGAMGQEDDVVEAVLTCEGDFHDPELKKQIERFRDRLKDLLDTESKNVQVRKVEPWNSVKVTVTIPRDAAVRLRQLAQSGNEALRQIGILSVQVQGDSQIALTFAGNNNENREVIFSTSPAPRQASTVEASQPPTEAVVTLDDLTSSSPPGSSSDEVTRRNIVDYLKQGPHLRQNATLTTAMGSSSMESASLHNPVSGSGQHPHPFQPNNIPLSSMGPLHSQVTQGSQMLNNFPMKNSGAFHPLTSSHVQQRQANSINSPVIQSAAIRQLTSIAATVGPGPHTNSFNPVGPTAPSSPSASNFFMDLPPPPPYPHSSNSIVSAGVKSGSSSSPMLVNLLQTDPSFAAAGQASGNPNKPLTVGDNGVSESPPKKKRKKKQKPAITKVELSKNQTYVQVTSQVSQSPGVYKSSASVVQIAMGTGSHVTSGVFGPGVTPSPGFGASRIAVSQPNIENQHKSAIRMRPQSHHVDSFSLDTAAGKIINPYTGQLEPRDPELPHGPTNSATQKVVQSANDMEDIAQNSVPNFSSVSSSVYVSSPTINTTTTTTTAATAASTVISGQTSQLSRVSDASPSVRGNLSSPNIYAGSPQNRHLSGVAVSSPLLLPSSQTGVDLQQTMSRSSHTVDSANKLYSDPAISDHDVVSARLHATGSTTSPSESVIFSNVRVSLHSANSTSLHPSMLTSQARSSQVFNITTCSLPPTVSPSVLAADSHVQPTPTIAKPPSLLNSVGEKHMDLQSSTESPPDTKTLSEGDENSNHSGMVTDVGPEQNATAALIEHSRVKIENHDSGVGSASERSDDTPSEPGDGELRTGHTDPEVDESGLKPSLSTQKLMECKVEPIQSSTCSTSTATVAVPSSSTGSTYQKSSGSHKSLTLNKRLSEVPTVAESSGSDITQFYDAHCKTMEKQAGLMSVQMEKPESNLHQPYVSTAKENGPLCMPNSSMENRLSPKMNGPIPRNTVAMAITDCQPKRNKLTPKQTTTSSKGLPESLREEQEQQPVKEFSMEKLSKLQQSFVQGEDNQEEPMSISHHFKEHSEQMFLDLEEVQAKMGNGAAISTNSSSESKGGNNITSIYSKRSSPVNVNMLNHVYTSGLPQPRRLTESVQRLVKPLPASEMAVSVNAPVSRSYSKSPVSSPRAGTPGIVTLASSNGPQHSLHTTRISNHSGARSPGASMPRLIPSDQHRLVSGGLDLAGLSDATVNCVRDFGLHASSNLLRDSKPYSGRMLSQSYPPFKSREANKCDVQASVVMQHSFLDFPGHHLKENTQLFYNSHPTAEKNVSKAEDAGINHSNHHVNVSTTVHSKASSPLMPTLQRGQDPPLSLTTANSSSHPPLIRPVEAAQEEASLKHVPYSPVDSQIPPLPTLSPVTSSPLPPLMDHGDSSKSLVTGSVTSSPKLLLGDRSSPPKLTRAPISPKQFNRNIFESVAKSNIDFSPPPKTNSEPSICDSQKETANILSSSNSDDQKEKLEDLVSPQTEQQQKGLTENGSTQESSGHDKQQNVELIKKRLSDIDKQTDSEDTITPVSHGSLSESSTVSPHATDNPTKDSRSSPKPFLTTDKPIATTLSTSKISITNTIAETSISNAQSVCTSSLSSNQSVVTSTIPSISVTATSSSPIKEPILETLASTLRQQQSSKSSDRPAMVPLTPSDISKLEQTRMLQSRMVPVQSGSQQKPHVESGDNSGSSQSRAMRKRKVENAEFDGNKQSSVGKKLPDLVEFDGTPYPIPNNESVSPDEHKGLVATKIVSDLEKSQERRRHRSTTSSSHSDDGLSQRSSSSESRDSSHSRSRTAQTSTPQSKSHHRDVQSKENRSHRVGSHHSSDVDWSDDSKVASGTKLLADKSTPEVKVDEGQKKGHRVRRQFYAYVPEKSLDQTYFDVPILSGRTRSKNKPAEDESTTSAPPTSGTVTVSSSVPSCGSMEALSTDNSPSAVVSTTTVSSLPSGPIACTAASEAAGGKRSTRSVRSKESSQEQNTNKRRKIQQQR